MLQLVWHHTKTNAFNVLISPNLLHQWFWNKDEISKAMWEKYYIFFRILDAADPKKLRLQKTLQLVWCTLDYGNSLEFVWYDLALSDHKTLELLILNSYNIWMYIEIRKSHSFTTTDWWNFQSIFGDVLHARFFSNMTYVMCSMSPKLNLHRYQKQRKN